MPFRRAPGRGLPRFGGFPVFPYAFPAYGWSPAVAYPPASDVVVVQVAPPSEQKPAEPPRPVESEIREYDWPAERPAEAEVRPVYFLIALRDQTVVQARAVWVQPGEVCYVTPEGARRRLSVKLVEPEATRNLNRKQGLRLELPVL